jgi:hypothetical protein
MHSMRLATNADHWLCVEKRNEEISFRGMCRKCQYQSQKEYNSVWFRTHSNYFHERIAIYYAKRGDVYRNRSKVNGARTKFDVLSHHSGNPPFCANPYGIHETALTDVGCFTMDHIDGKGLAHRRREKISGGGLCAWLKHNNYPDGFQVLCMNCQRIKVIENKENHSR